MTRTISHRKLLGLALSVAVIVACQVHTPDKPILTRAVFHGIEISVPSNFYLTGQREPDGEPLAVFNDTRSPNFKITFGRLVSFKNKSRRVGDFPPAILTDCPHPKWISLYGVNLFGCAKENEAQGFLPVGDRAIFLRLRYKQTSVEQKRDMISLISSVRVAPYSSKDSMSLITWQKVNILARVSIPAKVLPFSHFKGFYFLRLYTSDNSRLKIRQSSEKANIDQLASIYKKFPQTYGVPMLYKRESSTARVIAYRFDGIGKQIALVGIVSSAGFNFPFIVTVKNGSEVDFEENVDILLSMRAYSNKVITSY